MYIKENCEVRLFSKLDDCEKTYTVVRSGNVPWYFEKNAGCSYRVVDAFGGDGENTINIKSQLGRALLEHKEGDVVSYLNADGETEEYKILEIWGGSEDKVNTYGILLDSDYKQRNKNAIKAEIERRNIWRLCHLTRVENLVSILGRKEGIISQNSVRGLSRKVIINDPDRFDGYSSYVSCSVQRSNSLYYRAKSGNGACKDWAMLSIDPIVCCNDRTKFCRVNAATSRGWYLEGGYSGFSKMFMENIDIYPYKSRKEGMLDSFTTDEQAEVMIFHSIPLKYITGISFPNATVRDRAMAKLKEAGIEPDVRIRIESNMF